jgi:DNA helicase II / ATP-dependent DNA helicase PcrA
MPTFAANDTLSSLNPAQKEAVLHEEGPALILAGAGSGKTRVLTTRIARLIEESGVEARRILAVTFTNKAAAEMRSRIARILGAEPVGMWAGTFHSIGARMLRIHAPLVGRSADFTIYDEDDTLGLVKRIMEREGVSQRDWSPQAILSLISGAKNALVSPDEYAGLARDPLARNSAVVYRAMEPELRSLNAATFGHPGALPAKVRACAGGRVPGHESRPVPLRNPNRRRPGQRHGRWRRRSIHLWVARR